MEIENFSLLMKVIIIFFSLIGLYYKTGLEKKRFKIVSLIYFTNLSLIFCLIYFLFSIFLGENHIIQGFIGFIILCVTVTMTVYHFILVPNNRKKGKDYEIFAFSDIVVHYVVPILTIIYWIIFAEKGLFEYYYPFLWAIPFFIYLIIILLRAHYGRILEYSQTRYPYDFIDLDYLGLIKTSRNIAILSSIIIILGYIFLLIDLILKGYIFFN